MIKRLRCNMIEQSGSIGIGGIVLLDRCFCRITRHSLLPSLQCLAQNRGCGLPVRNPALPDCLLISSVPVLSQSCWAPVGIPPSPLKWSSFCFEVCGRLDLLVIQVREQLEGVLISYRWILNCCIFDSFKLRFCLVSTGWLATDHWGNVFSSWSTFIL